MSSSAERHARRAPSLAWPILLLVIASVLVATIVSFAVTFSGPPPFEPPRSLRSVAMALRGVAPPFDRGGMPAAFGEERPPFRHGPDPMRFGHPPEPLHRTREDAAPIARSGEAANPAAAARLAAELGTEPGAVVAFTRSGQDMGDAVSGSYSFGWHEGGAWYVVRSHAPPLLTRWHIRTMLAMLAAILLLSIPAWAITRALTGPLRRLAEAADQAGTGAALPALPGGSREVRDLARAVTTMHARLAGHAEARTAMLAGIAHDLGTPLARLSFRVELLPEEARARAAADIAEMRAMIGATLAFTRDEAGGSEAVRLDLGSLLDSLVQDMADAGAPVTLTPGQGARAIVRGDPAALRRLFANLIENAVRYGERAEVAFAADAGSVAVTVDDEGPGIDPAQAERLFQPFVRGDPSRNRATGGTGLGLAIVRSIATAHGGAATLGNRQVGENGAGGARARVVLPLSA